MIVQPCAGIGALVFHDNRVLLVQRDKPPHQGQWAIPGGKVKLGENLQKAAEREILEETGIIIKAGEPVYAFDLIEKDANNEIQFHYVIVDLQAKYISGNLNASSDARSAGWFSPADLGRLNLNKMTKELLQRYPNFAF